MHIRTKLINHVSRHPARSFERASDTTKPKSIAQTIHITEQTKQQHKVFSGERDVVRRLHCCGEVCVCVCVCVRYRYRYIENDVRLRSEFERPETKEKKNHERFDRRIPAGRDGCSRARSARGAPSTASTVANENVEADRERARGERCMCSSKLEKQ
jgi:hypothetical protein